MMNGKKSLTLVVSLILLAIVAVSGTIAFLVDQTGPVENTFIPTEITSDVDEDFDGYTKSNVAIVNTSEDVSAYIRAAVVINWKNDSNQIKQALDGDYDIIYSTDNGWIRNTDGFYYYTKPVAPGEATKVLIESCKPKIDKSEEGYYLDVVILGSAIQSEPIDAVQTAWKWTPPTTSN